jgi:hypothetical protein
MVAVMRSRRSQKFIVALALLLNLGGGPMAWAHVLGAGTDCHPALPSARLPHEPPAAVATGKLPATPFDDTLRPPIR